MAMLLEILKDTLELPNLIDEINIFYQDEQRRRQAFYQQITPEDKAEFINGEVVFQSPVRLTHTSAGKRLLKLLDTYADIHDLGYVGYEKVLISLTRNDYEPDLLFFRKEVAQNFHEDQMQYPAPDFAVEILSKSTEKNDRGIKQKDYALHGVKEYWIIESKDKFVERYLLEEGEFKLIEVVKSGYLVSDVISGFKVPLEAIFDSAEIAARYF